MKTKLNLTIAGMIVGSLLTLAPLFGLLGTVFGMNHAFKTLGSSGIGNPQALSDSIGISLISTFTGIILYPVGIILLSVSLVFFFRFRTSPSALPNAGVPQVH